MAIISRVYLGAKGPYIDLDEAAIYSNQAQMLMFPAAFLILVPDYVVRQFIKQYFT